MEPSELSPDSEMLKSFFINKYFVFSWSVNQFLTQLVFFKSNRICVFWLPTVVTNIRQNESENYSLNPKFGNIPNF